MINCFLHALYDKYNESEKFLLFAFFICMDKVKFSKLRKKFAENSIDELIDLLSSEDLQTRFFAEMCLRDATDT